MAKSLFYSIFNEIDELSEEYGRDGAYAIFEELEINAADAIMTAARQAKRIGDTAKSVANERLMEEQVKSLFSSGDKFADDKPTVSVPSKMPHKDVEMLASIWLDGFISRLLMAERDGKTWDRIESISDIYANRKIPQETLYGIITTDLIEMSRTRAIHLMFDFRQRPRPQSTPMLSSADKIFVRLGQAMFMDGFLVATVVPFRSENE